MIKKLIISFIAIGFTLVNTDKCFSEMAKDISQAQQSICDILNTGNLDTAKTIENKLMSDFANHKDLPEAIYWTARHCEWTGKYDEAIRLHNLIIQKFPDSSFITNSKLGIARSEIMSLAIRNDSTAIKENINKMISDFSGLPDLPESIYMVAEEYKWSRRFEDAKAIYQILIQTFPDSTWTNKATINISSVEIMSFIVSQDYTRAKANIEKLKYDFDKHSDLPEVLYLIAERYKWTFNFAEANQIYQQVIQKYPDNRWASSAKIGLSNSNILFNVLNKNYDNPKETLDKLVSDFGKDPNLHKAILIAGEQYFKDGLSKKKAGLIEQAQTSFDKASKIWNEFINRFPDSCLMPEAYCWACQCFNRMGKYEDSIQCSEKVIGSYPYYEYTWLAQAMIGRDFECMKSEGLISESEANTLIKDAYQQLVLKWPKCPSVEDAQNWLNNNPK